MSGPAQGASTHGPDCACTRCRGFEKGNGLAVRHGGWSVVRLQPRAAEIADGLRDLVPGYCATDEPAVQMLALVLARVEAATAALHEIDEAIGDGRQLKGYVGDGGVPFQRLREDLRGWVNTSRRLMNDLGMTPTSRAKLGLDLTRAKGEALRAHVAERYGEQADVG